MLRPQPLIQHRPRTHVPALANNFPCAVPMRVSVCVSGVDGHGRAFSEHTTIEFGTPTEMMFSSALPLQHGDKVRIINQDGSFDVLTSVVATRYRNGKSAVAVRIDDLSSSLPLKKF